MRKQKKDSPASQAKTPRVGGAISSAIKRKILKEILLTLTDLSPANLIRAVGLAERFFINRPDIKEKAAAIKKAFQENHPTTRLVIDALSGMSPKAKEKFIGNFFVNAGIVAHQNRKKLEQKLGFELPWFFVVSPTARCNLKCLGCYASEYSKTEDLSFAEFDRILKEAKKLGIHFITISGGEPFSYPFLFKILKKHDDMFFQIYTNGTLITDETAKKLARLGNAAPAISVEGLQKETDARRGEGTFAKILKAMDNLKRNGVLFGFSATCTSKNSEILGSDEFIDFFIKQGCRFGWYFQYVPIGRKPDVSLMSSPQQRNNLRLRITRIRNKKPIFIGDFWNDGPKVRGCMAAARPGGYFHINCQGDVEPCVFFQFSVDNAKNKSLLEIIKSPFFQAIRDAQPYCDNENLLSPCAIIDNPWVMREVVKKYKARPSYNGGNDLIDDPEVIKFLDNYSKEYKKIVDPVWEREWKGKAHCWKCGSGGGCQ
ncbi:MAG: radical SAM protein [Patescibacteria group bacterium]|nr:radical SAM protein [Patescibacteria group bacterium]